MSVAQQIDRPMTQQEFFAWAEGQDQRYEFDGTAPVAMTGGTVDHSQLMLNIQAALRNRLAGSGCRPLGPDAGMATVGGAIRYPDALVTCTKVAGSARVVPEVVVVFEVISQSSDRVDRIVKVREYQAVESIRRYIIVERKSIGLTVFERASGAAPWTASTLASGETLDMPEIGVAIPIDEFYASVDFD